MQGRGFVDEDATDGRVVALINETAARQFWPDQDPLGKRVVRPAAPERPFEVIGVVRDARLPALITEMRAAVLLPFGQLLSEPATLHIHTEGPPTALTSAVTDVVRRRDPTLALYGVTSMDRQVYGNPVLTLTRLGARMIGALGAWVCCWRRWGSTASWRTRSPSGCRSSAFAPRSGQPPLTSSGWRSVEA